MKKSSCDDGGDKLENTLLWAVFAELSRAELRLLDRFVRSPFFNRKDHVNGLFDYLRHCLEQEQTPVQEAAYKAAYGIAPYDDQKMRFGQEHNKKVGRRKTKSGVIRRIK